MLTRALRFPPPCPAVLLCPCGMLRDEPMTGAAQGDNVFRVRDASAACSAQQFVTVCRHPRAPVQLSSARPPVDYLGQDGATFTIRDFPFGRFPGNRFGALTPCLRFVRIASHSSPLAMPPSVERSRLLLPCGAHIPPRGARKGPALRCSFRDAGHVNTIRPSFDDHVPLAIADDRVRTMRNDRRLAGNGVTGRQPCANGQP